MTSSLALLIKQLIYNPRKETTMENNEQYATEAFEAILEELANLYAKKNRNYGNSADDTFREFGMVAYLVRLSDEMAKLKHLSLQGQMVEGEAVRDTLKDLAVYSILAVKSLDDYEKEGNEDISGGETD